ncbi:MAG TPA: glutathione S-transferase family protein [Rhizorhapis sp.]|nr:glutathione S-transferase family protein [Rhizorhapis sp.]
MTVVVHHLENSRSQRILWLLQELDMPYRVQRYERDPDTMRAPSSLREVHPLGRSPVIEDGPHVIIETGAIVEYLVEKADGKLGPPPHRETIIRYRQFLHYAEGSMMPPLMALLVVGRLGLLGRPARKAVQGMLDEHLDWLESELAERPYFAGDQFTAADIVMSFPLELSRSRAGLDRTRPKLIDWLDRMHARPAYRAALKAGGPYAYA